MNTPNDGSVPGATTWVVADGYIPPTSNGPEPAMTSHDSICMVNLGDVEADVRVWIYFQDREPAGPFLLPIGARRARHERINDLNDPETIPPGTDYSIVVRSDTPVVVQHTRLDSRQAENALMSTLAYPVN